MKKWKKYTRVIVAFLIIAMMAASVAACNGGGADDGKITLIGMGWGATENQERMTEMLFEAHPELRDRFEIEWIIGRERMVIKVNGEIHHIGSNYGYIQAFKANPEYSLPSAVTICTSGGSTLTVEKLRITEI